MRRFLLGAPALMALSACSGLATPSEASVPADASTVARVVCEADGSTSVPTPDVLAQPDGVHVKVVSRLDEPASVSVKQIGWDVDPGPSRSVVGIPPGRAMASCWPFSEHAQGGNGLVPVPITIHDPDGLFVDGELQCTDDDDGLALDIRLLASPRGREGVSITPEEARPLIGGLLPTDEILITGYPDTLHQSVVVARDGRRIASVGFSSKGGRWIQAGGLVCGGPAVNA